MTEKTFHKSPSQIIKLIFNSVLKAIRVTVAFFHSNTGATIIKSDLDTSEFEVVPVTSQTFIEITNLSSGKVHYSLVTGVTTSNAFISRNEQIILKNYSGSVFIAANTGSGKIVQIDQGSDI